jgi:hypothetical protein
MTSGTDAWRFDSDEISTLGLRPELKVTFTTATPSLAKSVSAVPEPSAGVVVFGALAATLARRRRKSS